MTPSAEFDYPLPPELIAQTPAARRDDSRLLVVDRASRSWRHVAFRDLPSFLRPSDRIFRNNVAVLPARLSAVRPTGGRVECLLLEERDGPDIWRCLLRPARKLPEGAIFADPDGAFRAEVVAEEADGAALVQFSLPPGETVWDLARRQGDVPLPPYIARPDRSRRPEDLERYQTVYADPERQVAVAAPTAGLHFTPELLARIDELGAQTFEVTLRVGLGTFRPISAEHIEAHAIHREVYEIPARTQGALFGAPGRRLAVGTTTVRAIEDFLARASGPLDRDEVAEADIYLYPPRVFRGVDALITNFHQPRSTLLCLVAAFLAPGTTDGIAWLKEIYADAVANRYRFLSYGDAMLIL